MRKISLLILALSGLPFLACEEWNRWFPPEDFYEPLSRTELQLRTGAEVEVHFSHKYAGKHVVELQFPEWHAWMGRTDSTLRLSLVCVSGGNVRLEQISSAPYSSFLGPETGGIAPFLYDVPRDLPRGKKCVCRIAVLAGDEALVEQFGVPQIVFRNSTTL